MVLLVVLIDDVGNDDGNDGNDDDCTDVVLIDDDGNDGNDDDCTDVVFIGDDDIIVEGVAVAVAVDVTGVVISGLFEDEKKNE